MKKISEEQAYRVGTNMGIDFNVVPLYIFTYGLNVVLEHGSVHKFTNVTNDRIFDTAKIAVAHLMEYPDYYQRLKRMEDQAEKFWSTRSKPSIFI